MTSRRSFRAVGSTKGRAHTGAIALNDGGQVSFAVRMTKGGEAIIVSKKSGLTTVARTEPGQFNFFGFDTSVNNQGQVAFKAELDEEFGFDKGLFVRDGKLMTIYLASTSPFLGDDSRPSINDSGQIAFQAQLEDGRTLIVRATPLP